MCTALQAVASPLGHSTVGLMPLPTFERMTGFEPATLPLGKVMRYQLRYIRVLRNEIVTRCEARQ